MYILPEKVKEMIDSIGCPVSILGSEEAINKLVNDKIEYPSSPFPLQYKIFNDKDTGIRYIANTKVPNDHDSIYILLTEQTKEGNNEQSHTIRIGITDSD